MPRLTEEQNQKLKDERREQILDAALKVFARKGLAATKISDIAAAANLSYGLVYHYFESKEVIFTALVERAMLGTMNLTRQLVDGPGSAWERLGQLVSVMLEGLSKNPEYPLLIIQAIVNEDAPGEAKAVLQRYSASEADNIQRLIEQGQAEGSVKATGAARLAVTLTALVQGLAISRMQSSFPEEIYPNVESVLSFLKA